MVIRDIYSSTGPIMTMPAAHVAEEKGDRNITSRRQTPLIPRRLVANPQTATELIWKGSYFGDGWGTLKNIST